MAVNQKRYAEEFEKGKFGGLSEEVAHTRAVRLATIKKAAVKKSTTRRKKKPSEEGLVKRTRRRLREIYYGKKTYLPKKTTRLSAAKKQLETAKSLRQAREKARAASRRNR